MTVRLLDIARHAKVSLGVVSSVVNRSKSNTVVSAETKRRILNIAKEMGYIPNAAARAVRHRRFNRIAAAIVQYGRPGTAYIPHNGYVDAAVNELAERGYSLVLEPLHLDYENDRFYEPPRLFSELAVDGVLGLPISGIIPPQVDEQLACLKAPVIWMNRNPEETANNVLCDEPAGARLLVRHLLDLGHSRIGFLGFKTPHYAGKQRYETIAGELIAAGLDTSGLVLAEHADFILDAVERVLTLQPAVTALICQNNLVSRTAFHLIASRGMKVPGDMSLCHFGSPWEPAMTKFPITMLEVPEARMAVTAVDMLLNLIEGKTLGEPPKFVGTLQLGKTTAIPETGGLV